MDSSGGTTRFRLRKTLSSDRLLGVLTHSPTETAASGSDDGVELDEDDVFWTGDFAEQNHSSNSPSTSTTQDNHHHHHHHHDAKGFCRAENFGILAALPMTGPHRNFQSRSVFNHKASVSSSSSSSASSSRMIPTIPKKPPLDRQTSVNYHQSAPVDVPVLSDAMRRNRAIHEFDDLDDEDNEGDSEMLPPHEIVASKQSPIVACSVLEGVGRTLKGRDLRQVRNAVWRKTLPPTLVEDKSEYDAADPYDDANVEEFETGNEEFDSDEVETVNAGSGRVLNSSVSTASNLPILTVKEKKELASYAHSLGKKLKSQQVGKSGVTDSVVTALIETLEANELLKLKVHGTCPGELDDVVKQLEEATGSVVVGQIGRTVILYRPSMTKLKAEEKRLEARRAFVRKRSAVKPSFQKKEQVPKLHGRGRRERSRF